MEGLVLEAREQIRAVQDELMMTEEERQSYDWFWDSELIPACNESSCLKNVC